MCKRQLHSSILSSPKRYSHFRNFQKGNTTREQILQKPPNQATILDWIGKKKKKKRSNNPGWIPAVQKWPTILNQRLNKSRDLIHGLTDPHVAFLYLISTALFPFPICPRDLPRGRERESCPKKKKRVPVLRPEGRGRERERERKKQERGTEEEGGGGRRMNAGGGWKRLAATTGGDGKLEATVGALL